MCAGGNNRNTRRIFTVPWVDIFWSVHSCGRNHHCYRYKNISDWGGLVKMKKKERKQNMGRKGRTFLSIVGMAALHSLLIGVQVMAAPQDGSAIIESGFDVVYTIIAAIVSAVGSLLLLWGLFEWAQALNTQDGGAQSMAFKRIASGLVACMGPQLIPLIQAGFSR
mgnify:FL=1